MKRFRLTVVAAGLLAFAALFAPATTVAQNWDSAQPYFTKEQMPDMLKWLPPHPEPGSAAFAYDVSQYEWGKEQRKDAERAQTAIRQAVYTMQTVSSEFGDAFGLAISPETTPEICRLLVDALVTCNNIAILPKRHYMRVRPFAYFDEPTLVPEDEEHLRKNGSYPSGHTILGWSAALLLSEINPAAADRIMAVGYTIGESRVIAGFHWQSDVDAGRLAASVAVMKLHTDERFLEQMSKARAEFAAKSESCQ